MSWLSTTPESLKLKVWSKSLATRKCTGSVMVDISLLGDPQGAHRASIATFDVV